MVNETGVPYVDGGVVLSAAIALPVIGLIAVALRFRVRYSTDKQGVGADDWLILAALAFECGMSACLIYGVAKKSVGYPSEPFPIPKKPEELAVLTETTPKQDVVFLVYWIVWLLMIPANGLIKLSATLFYRRIFVVAKRGYFDILSKTMFVVCLLWTIAFFVAQIFGCGTAFWKPFSTLGEVASCHTNARLNGLMLSDLLTDILVWLMPVVMVWRLHMSLSKKVSATAILLLAAVSLAAAIVRLWVEFQISYGGYAKRMDDDLVLTINLYWSMIETGLAVIAASLPIISSPIFRGIIKHYKSLVNSLQKLRHSWKSDDTVEEHITVTAKYTVSFEDANV